MDVKQCIYCGRGYRTHPGVKDSHDCPESWEACCTQGTVMAAARAKQEIQGLRLELAEMKQALDSETADKEKLKLELSEIGLKLEWAQEYARITGRIKADKEKLKLELAEMKQALDSEKADKGKLKLELAEMKRTELTRRIFLDGFNEAKLAGLEVENASLRAELAHQYAALAGVPISEQTADSWRPRAERFKIDVLESGGEVKEYKTENEKLVEAVSQARDTVDLTIFHCDQLRAQGAERINGLEAESKRLRAEGARLEADSKRLRAEVARLDAIIISASGRKWRL